LNRPNTEESSSGSRNQRPCRLAVVLSHPTQYYSPWFRFVQAQGEVELRVFHLWDFGVTRKTDRQFGTALCWDVDLLSGYESEFVPNVATDPGTHHFRGLDNPDLTRRLAAWWPDAILLFGYTWRSHLRVVRWARFRGIPLLFRGDSHFIGRGPPAWPKRLLLRLLYRQFSAFLTVGAANRDYFRALDVPESRLFFAPHAVDDSLFEPARADHQRAVEALRAELGLSTERTVILFAGKFLPAKQPVELLRAFIELRDPAATLLFVGDGPLREELRALDESHPDADVKFLPFANQSEMPARYLLADVFVLPSRGLYETWGLAVNEAMHMGVPALVSERVGCQRDLVTEGETGWVFRHDSTDELRAKLHVALKAMRSPETAAAMRHRTRDRIAHYTYPRTTDGLLTALRAISSPGK
jgi:glycosyltransferase involved in cell wall biosynthesis